MSFNNVIILDVDNTLIHSVEKSSREWNGKRLQMIPTPSFNVYLRPNLYQFLNYCFSVTPYVILWSAGTAPYIKEITDYVLNGYKFFHIITRNTFNTITKNVNWICSNPIIKNSMIIFIDDIPERIVKSHNTVVIDIFPFTYDSIKYDDHLPKISKLIELIIINYSLTNNNSRNKNNKNKK